MLQSPALPGVDPHAPRTGQAGGSGATPARARGVAALSLWSGYAGAAMLFAMLLAITYDVAMRYVFNEPTSWANELSTYLLVAVSFVGLAYAQLRNGHVRVELLVARLEERRRVGCELVTA
jgi:TRAP-type C4-dicarboxylate transport system permease small subunit